MRKWILVLSILLCTITSAVAQVSIGIGVPGVSIGINMPVYPRLVPVPGYPVYYAPQVNSNFFFYDGMYWVFQQDNWYASSWYNGPWRFVGPEAVPLFVLRIPVRYYRQPPLYFRGWRVDAPPRWGEHWGHTWEQRRYGWDHWNRSSVYRPAPLPAYQQQYSGSRYPHADQQQALQSRNYRYQPQDTVVQQHYQAQRAQGALTPPPQGRQAAPQQGHSPQQDQWGATRPSSGQRGVQAVPRAQLDAGGGEARKPPTAHAPPPNAGTTTQHQTQRPEYGTSQREQQAPRPQGQDKKPQGKAPKQSQEKNQDPGHEKGNKQGGERNNP
jgi:hypothetical protein